MKIIIFLQLFYGCMYVGMVVIGQEKIKIGFGLMLEGFYYLLYNDFFVFEVFGEEDGIVVVMFEIVQGEGGVNLVSVEFLIVVQLFCKEK